MVQFYEVTVILSAVIGWLLNDFFRNPTSETLKWIILLFAIVVINEKTALGEKISRWFRRNFLK